MEDIMVTFTALGKIYSTEYFLDVKVDLTDASSTEFSLLLFDVYLDKKSVF